jgi:hypothetical protein
MNISEAAKLRILAAAMINNAFFDLANIRKPVRALDAALWFFGDYFPFWAEIADLPFADPVMPFRRLGRLQAASLLEEIERMEQTGEMPAEIVGGVVRHEYYYSPGQVEALLSRAVPVLTEIINSKVANYGNIRSPKSRVRTNIQGAKNAARPDRTTRKNER